MQLTTVGREVWRGARKAQELNGAEAGDPTVQARLQKLKQVEAFRKHKVDWSEIQSLVGISRATYYRWKGRLREEGLKPKPKRPKRLRQKIHWTPESPKLNAHVERMQRTFRDEFYTRPLPSKIPELQRELDAYLEHYNRRRPHRALGGLAPLEYLDRIRGEGSPQSLRCIDRLQGLAPLEYLARIRGVAFPTGKHREAVPTESQMC
jgi:transposase InsO family protein